MKYQILIQLEKLLSYRTRTLEYDIYSSYLFLYFDLNPIHLLQQIIFRIEQLPDL
jgi:hypothetical protein